MFMSDRRIEWPKNEPIPQSMEEALKLGWKVDTSESTASEDERVAIGTVSLVKEVGTVKLYLEIPFQSNITYGKPFNAKSFIDIPDNQAEQLKSLERFGGRVN